MHSADAALLLQEIYFGGGLSYLLGPCQVQTRMSQVEVLISGETNLDNTQEGAVLCLVLHS